MSHHEKGSGRRGHAEHRRHKAKEEVPASAVVSDSAVTRAFLQYAAALDDKHDRFERVVKLSRDITIESKRIIFLLHSLDRESKMDAVLDEAGKRLSALVAGNFRSIASELAGQDPYEYVRAYSAGLQEFVEAATFHHYLKEKSLQDWTDIEKQLHYVVANTDTNTTDDNKSLKAGLDKRETDVSTDAQVLTIRTLVPPAEYILGLGDLTGELMRKCINSLGSGNIDDCYQTCAFVKQMYNGFLGIGNGGHKEIKRKLFTLKQSLAKMENACYTIHVRGSEIPKHMLADVFSGGLEGAHNDEDEGFY